MHPGILVIAALAAIFLESDALRRPTRTSSSSRNDPDPEQPPSPTETDVPSDAEIRPHSTRRETTLLDASSGDAYASDSGGNDSFRASVPPSEALTQLTLGICNQLVPCRSNPSRALYENCQRSIREGREFNHFFGLTSTDNFEALLQQRPEGLRVNSSALSRCLQGMLSVGCEEPEEGNDAGVASPGEESEEFSPLELALGEAPELDECGDIFSRQPVTCEGANFEGGEQTAVLNRLSNALCSRMATCFPDLACEACQAGALGTNMGIHLGLSSGSLAGLSWGLQTGLYQVHSEALDRCAQDIANSECSNLDNSWDPQSPNDFRNLSRWLPRNRNSCLGVLSEPRVTCEPRSQNPVMRLAAGICSIVGSCQPQSNCESCISGIMILNSFGDDLGMPRSERITLQALAERVERGSVEVNAQALQDCLSSLESTHCLTAQRALRTNASGVFTRLDSVLTGRSNCRRVFSNAH